MNERIVQPSGMDHQELERLHFVGMKVLEELAKNADTHEVRFKAADQLAWYALCQLNKVHDDAREDAKQLKEWEK